MKFFKCHSQKYKNELLIKLEDKFTDIGPDVFAEFSARYIILSERTKTLRDYAFAGLYTKCDIYLPPAIEEIEPFAFEGMGPDVTMYCRKGSRAAAICVENDINVSYDIDALHAQMQEHLRAEEEQKQQEAARLEAERLERERLEKERLERERIEQARLEAERLERERLAQEQERIEQERRTAQSVEESPAIETVEQEESVQETFAPATEVAESEVTVFIYDDLKGIRKNIFPYSSLPDDAKGDVVDSKLYIHCQYVDERPKSTFISRTDYEELVRSAPVRQEQDSEDSAEEENLILLHIFDSEQGEYTVSQPESSFSEEKRKYIHDGEAYAYKAIIDGQNVFEIVDKADYDQFKAESMSNNCPACGAPILSDGKFCTRCGYLIRKKKFCTQCGKEVSEESKFCRYCGTKV